MLRLGRWLPLLARARRVRGALGRRGGRPGPGSGGGSGGAGSNLSMVLATVMLFIPADVFKALMGAALLAYGGWDARTWVCGSAIPAHANAGEAGAGRLAACRTSLPPLVH